jgi:galactokinase
VSLNDRRARLIARARQGYRLTFPIEGPDPRRFFVAPGRVNLIGEHVDYNDGFVLPCAIDRETVVALSAGPERGGQGYVEVLAIDMNRARDTIALHEPVERVEDNWKNCIRGVIAALQDRGHTVLPARLSIAGDVPIGAGLSSSASFAVAVTLALTRISEIAMAPAEMALVAQEAEMRFMGTQCGIMDQMASACAARGAALLLDCRSLEHMPIRVAEDLALVIIDSGIRRELATSAFNTRREECEAAARHLGVASLRDASAQMLEAARESLDPALFARARHVISEIARIEPMAVALATGDTAAIARIMREGHESLRADFEVTVPEVDRLAGIVRDALEGGDAPMGGVRMTGAGFGGCLVAVVHASAAQRVLEAVHSTYNATAATPASADVYQMTGGAREIRPG